jgi:hypothetical protein
MEIFISNFIKVSDTKYVARSTHNMPFDEVHGLGKTREELLNEGALVEEPIEEYRPNTKLVTCYNPTTNECWYEYEELLNLNSAITEDRIAQLETDNANLKAESANTNYVLMMGGLI